MPSPLDLGRLRDAPWLRTPAIRRVFHALDNIGAVSRAVGGAVRNTLLGYAIDDVDLATTAKPEDVVATARKAGLHAIPTGLQHGTVTLVSDGVQFEVTTLRRDVVTDGRHAVVAFTDDWAADASRRDFTINALYADADGTLFDPLGGSADLAPTRIRFIGNARARIQEDYLRILRLFRFSARFGDGDIDRAGLDAASAERAGLSRIAAERVRVELLKLLVAPHAAATCRIMQAFGFLVPLIGTAPSPLRLERMADIEAANAVSPDPIRRLAALALYPSGDAGALSRRLRLSGDEHARLRAIAADMASMQHAPQPAEVRRRIYHQGAATCRNILMVGWAQSAISVADDVFRQRVALADTWTAPKLPVDGQDVMALGVAGGPDVGRLLSALDTWWQTTDFAASRDACLDELAVRVGR